MSLIPNYHAPIIPGGSFTWLEYCWLHEWTPETMPPGGPWGKLGDKVVAIPHDTLLPNGVLLTAQQQVDNAIFWATQIEPIRQELGLTIYISSGARPEAYNKFIGSRATMSGHITWQAGDLKCSSLQTNAEFYRYLSKRWRGRMELLHATPTWCHLDTRNFGERIRFNP